VVISFGYCGRGSWLARWIERIKYWLSINAFKKAGFVKKGEHEFERHKAIKMVWGQKS